MRNTMLFIIGLVLAVGCAEAEETQQPRPESNYAPAPLPPTKVSASQVDRTLADVALPAKPAPAPAVTISPESEAKAEPKAKVAKAAPPAEKAPDMDFTQSSTAQNIEKQLLDTEGVQLSELTLARGIDQRLPVDPGTEFSIEDDRRIYAFMKVLNPGQEKSEVTVSWAPMGGGKERGTVTVSVGAQKKWRTWAFTRSVRKPGQWQVIVRDADGQIIGRAPFDVLEKG